MKLIIAYIDLLNIYLAFRGRTLLNKRRSSHVNCAIVIHLHNIFHFMNIFYGDPGPGDKLRARAASSRCLSNVPFTF